MNLLTQKLVVMSPIHLKKTKLDQKKKSEKESFSSNCSNKQNIIVRKIVNIFEEYFQLIGSPNMLYIFVGNAK